MIPASTIQCSVDVLHQLLLDLDTKAWSCDENEGASIYYERKPVGSGVVGGMGGGASTGNLWIQTEFDEIKEQIRAVIVGDQESLDL